MSETIKQLRELYEEFREKARTGKGELKKLNEGYAAGINRAIAEIKKAEKQREGQT